jgi:hypothetical protein
MKKTNRKQLELTTTTVRALKDLAAVSGGVSQGCLITHACYTKPAGGCP